MTIRKSLQLTLALIKPDAVRVPYVMESINDTILSDGFLVIQRTTMQLSPHQAQMFYQEHKQKFFYNRLVTFMASGPLEALILLREGGVARWRQLMGPTKVYSTWRTHPETIRGMWGLTDTRNTTHGSDSTENALKEIDFFFPKFDVKKWEDTNLNKFQTGSYKYDEDESIHKPV